MITDTGIMKKVDGAEMTNNIRYDTSISVKKSTDKATSNATYVIIRSATDNSTWNAISMPLYTGLRIVVEEALNNVK